MVNWENIISYILYQWYKTICTNSTSANLQVCLQEGENDPYIKSGHWKICDYSHAHWMARKTIAGQTQRARRPYKKHIRWDFQKTDHSVFS